MNKKIQLLKNIQFLIGVVSIVYYFYIKFVFGGLAFSEFFLYLGIILIGYNYIKDKILKNYLVNILIKISISIVLTAFILGQTAIIAYPKHNIKGDSDYLIILGASVKKTTPSLTLKARLDSAIEYLSKTNDDCYIVVSGGKGDGEHISEALAMKNYLIENSIDEDRIIVEDNSTNTFENFKYSKGKIEKHSNKNIRDLTIKVVTTDFHSFRSSILAKRNGYNEVTFYTSKSKTSFIPVYYTREFLALAKIMLLY